MAFLSLFYFKVATRVCAFCLDISFCFLLVIAFPKRSANVPNFIWLPRVHCSSSVVYCLKSYLICLVLFCNCKLRVTAVPFLNRYFVFFLFSLGCGIGYGYLHRIPNRSTDSVGPSKPFPGSDTSGKTPSPGGFTDVLCLLKTVLLCFVLVIIY